MARKASASVGFDRAAVSYDRTRILSPEASLAQTEVLRSELAGRGRSLDVGVGTGAIALALAEAGVDVVGIDISMPMLAKLVEKAGGRAPFPLALADATALPFADDAFGGAVARHVLHLIPEWNRAVAELVRVVRPGGLLLVNQGGFTEGAEGWEVVDRFLAVAGGLSFAGLDPREPARLDAALAAHGATVRELPPIPERLEQTVGAFIDEMEQGVQSWTWRVDEGTRRSATVDVRAWALERFGSLDRPLEPDLSLAWRAYDLP